MKPIHLIFIAFTISTFACKKRYIPEIRADIRPLLVVEGVLNASPDTTVISLTRLLRLDDTTRISMENNATVTVEGSDNIIRQLTDKGRGYYISGNLNLTIGENYRLRIKTIGGKEYLSDYTTAKRSGPIDSVTWSEDDKGIHIFVNTSDPDKNTRYYRWEYDETWEIRSYYISEFVIVNGATRPRILPDEDVYTCWRYDFSTNVFIANTTNLEEDIIIDKQLITIPPNSEKLGRRYSFLVKQYALDKRGYEFFEQMKKNTEDVGSLFSPQPVEIKGNINCLTNPDEPVLGFVSASTMEKKRIFLSDADVPLWRYHTGCERIPGDPAPLFPYNPPIPISNTRHFFDEVAYSPYGYEPISRSQNAAFDECISCIKRRGYNRKPWYW